MKYMGSKARFSKDILPVVLRDRIDNQWYVEPFAGGMNMICNVVGNRIANDINRYLVAMWEEMLSGWTPRHYTREEYKLIRDNKPDYPDHVVGWVGFGCSFSGRFFQGYASDASHILTNRRDYQDESFRNISKQLERMRGVVFSSDSYFEMEIPDNSIIYCDPPYNGTKEYLGKFDSGRFWEWAKGLSRKGHQVFVSEYDAPSGVECVWEKSTRSTLSTTGVAKNSLERLFKV